MRNLLHAYDEPEQKHGSFLRELSQVSCVWLKPSQFFTDVSEVTKLLGPEQPTGLSTVQLTTMKKAKGLEAHVVIMVGLEEGIMPDPKADNEEEARLFYVSMTRASEKLFLLHSFKRPGDVSHGEEWRGRRRSRFLDAIGRDSKWIKL